ncbi:sigma-70 family RNA polymerase sigma factor [Agrococcus sp. 1P02AA]|uniref:sigma-70 family RNA polymerase sigma factor n=1 Tax=Agrococcus sp. 1P02AA TaxID=3132259 RepID=UPI0039A6C7E7
MKAPRAAEGTERATAAHLETLLRRARRGDNLAVGELLQALRPLMFHVAHQRATPTMPADDLVATATLRFIESLAKGGGPTSNPGAYLTTSIRNLAIDHGKLRETANVSLDASVGERRLEFSPQDHPSVELLIERSAVRAAFARLKPEQRKVLHETAVDGRKPADIAGERGQSANTISAKASRARAALTIELRAVMLARLGAEGCLPFREELSRDGAAKTPEAIAHLEGCRRCARALESFKAIPAVLAALPLVVAGGGAMANATAKGAAAVAAGTAAVGAAQAAPAKGVFAGEVGRTTALLLSSSAVAAVAAGGIWLAQREPAVVESPIAMQVSTTERAGTTDIAVAVEPRAGAGGPVTVTVELPDSMQVASAPADWACSHAPGGSTCELPAGAVAGQLSVETLDGNPASGAYSVSVSAASDALSVTGTADGSISVQ